MRNLKKMLSLVMALAMIASFMVVGASAADFTDVKDIKNTDAVQTLVSLGVLKGYEDGSFKPEGTVTRAEMAKMICVVMNGGKDPSLGSAITNFKDVASNHWAAGYISYCDNMGYISGYEDGTFKPDADVTGTQAAKMLLTAIGFSADAESYTGANWAINVDVRANGRGIYDELGGTNPALGLTRDNAAQMVYNAVGAQMVEYNYTPVTEGGQITLKPVLKDMNYLSGSTNYPETILHAKFGMATSYGYMTGFSYDSVKEKYTYSFSSSANFGAANITDGPFSGSLKTSIDFTNLFGQKVKVLYKNTDTVFGMYAEDSSVLVDGFTGNLPTIAAGDDSVKVSGTVYKLDGTAATIPVYNTNGGRVSYLKDLAATDALYTLRLIDNDGNGKLNAVIITPVTLAKIGYVGKDSVTLSAVGIVRPGVTLGNKDIEDVVIYDNYTKDDYVLFTQAAYTKTGDETITKVELTTGSVEGSKSGNQFMVDGEWLTNSTATTLSVNDTIDCVVLGGRIYYAKVTTGATGSGALAMVYDVAHNAGLGTSSSSIEAKIIFADGTKKTVNIAKINGADVSAAANVDIVTFAGTNAAGQAVVAATIRALLVGELVTYKVNNDGDYELKNIANAAYAAPAGAKILGYDGTTAAATYVNSSNSVDSKELANDAKVFVFVGDKTGDVRTNKAYVYSGKEMKNTGANYGSAVTNYSSALYGKVNGFTYAQAVILNATALAGKPGIITGTNYGYLVSDAYQSHTDTKDYVNFKYWDGTQNVEAKAEGSDLTGFKAGAVITFDTVSSGIIKNVSVPSTVTGQITGWDGTKKVSLGGSNREISDDTVILYVNSKDKVGTPGSIGLLQEAADVNGDGTIESNARWIVPAGTGVALLVFDVNNNMKAAPAIHVATVVAAITELANTNSVALDGNIAAGTWSTLLASLTSGKTLTVNGSVTAAAAAQTLTGNLIVNGTFTTDSGNAFTVASTATLQVNTLAGTAGQLVLTNGSTVIVNAPDATAMGILENAAAKVAGATVVLGSVFDASAASTWYTSVGTPDTDATVATNGTAATAIASGSSVPAGTYVYGTYGYTGLDGATSPSVAGWFLQK